MGESYAYTPTLSTQFDYATPIISKALIAKALALDTYLRVWQAANVPTLGEVIRDARERLGLSTQELADRSRVDKGTINRIENGKQEARGSTLRRLADALGVSVEAILRAHGCVAGQQMKPQPLVLAGAKPAVQPRTVPADYPETSAPQVTTEAVTVPQDELLYAWSRLTVEDRLELWGLITRKLAAYPNTRAAGDG